MTERTCSEEDCTKPLKARGLCDTHYARLRRAGLPERPIRVCGVDGCGRKHNTAGYCYTHYVRLKNTGTVGSAQIRTYKPTTVRDEQGRKQCRTCRIWQPETEFQATRNCADGLNPRCKTCKRSDKLRANFGLSLAQYEALVAAQTGACAICGDNQEILHVDHDHACCPTKGKSCGQCVRQLLCQWCNRAIGMFKDDPKLLRAAADYVERHRG
ncbi:endonuclease domain-containing protein [Nonomuraea turcica]|uniref:endonuclease domain-containing protein n=1 Tax=Nonomuraea sp. G32 TaxID=3067274 RepID=UPI00273C5D22|nr:endonuclease domain-containing protein [Nonomuraea sp. G32]MDP4501044.1 endonuclease domain-containing protein [Nonomuraea sp. G32]